MKRIFIFGSNATGFHGAGSAGWAFRGNSDNNWRSCPIMDAARQHGDGYKGVLAVYGQARGLQQGTRGWSYAVQTITKPGARRSLPLEEIASQVDTLIKHMSQNPEDTYCLTPIGCGYSGYTVDEMKPLWEKCLAQPNCRWARTVPEKFASTMVHLT